MKTLQDRIDAIREEFQDARPDVVMVIDELADKVNISIKILDENCWELNEYNYTHDDVCAINNITIEIYEVLNSKHFQKAGE